MEAVQTQLHDRREGAPGDLRGAAGGREERDGLVLRAEPGAVQVDRAAEVREPPGGEDLPHDHGAEHRVEGGAAGDRGVQDAEHGQDHQFQYG